MEELNITIGELELKENDLHCEICKPTDYGKCPSVNDLLELEEPTKELGKVVYALNVLRSLKESIEYNNSLNINTEE